MKAVPHRRDRLLYVGNCVRSVIRRADQIRATTRSAEHCVEPRFFIVHTNSRSTEPLELTTWRYQLRVTSMAQPSSIGSRAITCVAEVGLAGNIRVDADEPAPRV